MIRYALLCSRNHSFDGWFRDAAAFSDNVDKGQVACPVCGCAEIRKSLMAPSVRGGKRRSEAEGTPGEPRKRKAREGASPVADVARMAALAKAVRSYVETHAVNVGSGFPEEARRMHYGETERRSVYGTATADEIRSLREESIPCLPLPFADRQGEN